jgi:SAM-dependent methyltransferase
MCVSFSGLHCLPDPAAAVREITRCLKPGGRLVGDSVVRGAGLRQDLAIRAFRRVALFDAGGTVDELRPLAHRRRTDSRSPPTLRRRSTLHRNSRALTAVTPQLLSPKAQRPGRAAHWRDSTASCIRSAPVIQSIWSKLREPRFRLAHSAHAGTSADGHCWASHWAASARIERSKSLPRVA